MSTVIEEKIAHNHKKNFGRYVAECPACVAKYPDGPPERKARSKEVAEVAKSAGMTEEQLMRIMVEANRALGVELRRADPEVEAEKLAQKTRMQIAKQHERQVIEDARAITKASQDYCASMGHKQNQGRSQQSAIGGQVHSDGLFHWICVTCQATGTRRAHMDELQMGAG